MTKRVLNITLALLCLFIPACGGGGPTTPPDNNPPIWDKPRIGISVLKPGLECLTVYYGTADDPDSDHPLKYRIYYIDATATGLDDPFLGPGRVAVDDPDGVSPLIIPDLVAGHEYYCGVHAVDPDGNEDPNIQKLHAVPLPGGIDPIPIAKAEHDPAPSGRPVHFSGAGSRDPDGGVILKYEWDWNNDGVWDVEGPEAEHAWYQDGVHEIDFRVTDDESQMVSLERPLTVNIVSGTLMWSGDAGGLSDDVGYAVTALSDDSTVVTGLFTGTATFGEGEPNQTVLSSAGSTDIFLARYNPDGTLAWAKRAGGNFGDAGRAVAALPDDSIAVTGRFSHQAHFGQGEPNYTWLTSAGQDDIFIARYYPDGTLRDAYSGGGPDTDAGTAIAALPDGSIVVAGLFGLWLVFDDLMGPDNTAYNCNYGGSDMFVAHLDLNGKTMWVTEAGGWWDDAACAITALSDGSTAVCAYYETTPDSPGGEDIIVARYNPDGTLAWAKNTAAQRLGSVYGIDSLSDDSIVVSGTFTQSTMFGEGEPNATFLTCSGWENFFIARYNSDGSLAWVRSTGTEQVQGYGRADGTGVTVLSDDSVVAVGFFNCPDLVFGKGERYETVLYSTGNDDIFVARYYPDGDLVWARTGPSEWAFTEVGNAVTALSDDSTVVTGFTGRTWGGPGLEVPWNVIVARFSP